MICLHLFTIELRIGPTKSLYTGRALTTARDRLPPIFDIPFPIKSHSGWASSSLSRATQIDVIVVPGPNAVHHRGHVVFTISRFREKKEKDEKKNKVMTGICRNDWIAYY